MPLPKYQSPLPLEIILSVLEHVVLNSETTAVALVPGDPATKTILALLLTSRTIYHVARPLLYARCMYMHTPRRLSMLVRSFKSSTGSTEDPRLPFITSLYLRPVPYDGNVANIDLSTIKDTADLLELVRPHLSRLLVDMPLRDLFGYHGGPTFWGFQPLLQEAFIGFPLLEEFCSVRDELCSSERDHGPRPPAWSSWPNLRRLALYNVDVSDDEFWIGVRKLQHIETVVLTRSDGSDDVDVHQMWRNQFNTKEEMRPLTIVLANVESNHLPLRGRDNWTKDEKLKVETMNIPISYYGDENVIDLCQLWIKRKFLLGTLFTEWSVDGKAQTP